MENTFYEIYNLIGEGSFGKVYKARSRQNNTLVAYKVISKNGRSLSEVFTLRKECEIQKHLQHPNIIRMLDSFETEKEIVVVTEFAVRDLCQILKQEGVFSELKAKRTLHDLVSALYYLHSNRVLHRDLKPQNVLLDAQGTAKLCDFGFAKSLGNDLKVLTSIKGTPLYMAPELVNEVPYDHNADLWSLGCIAYELLTGHTPYTTTSIVQLIKMIKLKPIEWPDYLSEICLTFLQGLLQKNPIQRLSWPYLLYHPFICPSAFQYFPPIAGYCNMSLFPERSIEPPPYWYDYIALNTPVYHRYDANTRSDRNAYVGSASPLLDMDLAELQNLIHRRSTVYPSGLQLTQPAPPARQPVQRQDSIEEDSDAPGPDDVDPDDPGFVAQKEEWLEFVKKNIWDVIYENDTDMLSQSHSLVVIMNAFNRCQHDPLIVANVSKLLSLPFVVESVSEGQLNAVKETYYTSNIIKDLLKVGKQVIINVSQTEVPDANQGSALQQLFILISNLTFTDLKFLKQFFSCCVSLNFLKMFKHTLLVRTKEDPLSVVKYHISVTLRLYLLMPQSRPLIVSALQNCISDFLAILREQGDLTVHTRICTFITVLGFTRPKFLSRSTNVEELIQELITLKNTYSSSALQKAADGAIEVLQTV